MYDKIHFRPPHEDYYSKFEITPGINFIKKLFSHEKAEKYINDFKINMPETYWNDTEIYFIYNGKQSTIIYIIYIIQIQQTTIY
jgi:hypothetical protein